MKNIPHRLKSSRQLFATILLLGGLAHEASADKLDEHQSKGLKDTQQMLKSPALRKEAIKNDKTAQEVDAKVEALAGPGKNKEEIYDVASQVMATIAAEAKGDPEKMQQLLLEAQNNPQAFYNKYFNDAQKAKVRTIANDIENKKGGMGAPR